MCGCFAFSFLFFFFSGFISLKLVILFLSEAKEGKKKRREQLKIPSHRWGARVRWYATDGLKYCLRSPPVGRCRVRFICLVMVGHVIIITGH